MKASRKQLKFIRDLMNKAGSPIPEHPKFDRAIDVEEELHLLIETVEDADAYIKKHQHLMLKAKPALRFKAWAAEVSKTSTRDAYNVPK